MNNIEEQIRDKLINKLHLLEGDLSCLDKEFYLRNDEGTRGFVDILAKDSINRHVLIELKRSKAASREALHEILKYIEGIKYNKSLKNDEIVVFIVSTEWDELLVPFSSFIKKVSYAVTGYKLVVDEKLNPISAEIIQPLELKNERFLSDLHNVCLYKSDENLTKGIESHQSSFAEKGIEDYILLILKPHPDFRQHELQATMRGLIDAHDQNETELPMSYEELESKLPEHKHMIYSSVQVMDNEKYWEIIRKDEFLYEEAKEFIEGLEGEDVIPHLHEYAVHNSNPRPYCDHCEIGTPVKLGNQILENEKWKIERVIRGGRLKNNELLTDGNIINELTGDSGSNNQKYFKYFVSNNSSSFKQISKEIGICLKDNQIWLSGITKAIDEISNLPKKREFEGEVTIYNPSNTLLSIYHAATSTSYEDSMRWIPTYCVNVRGGEVQRTYFGCLIENNNSVSLKKVLEQAFDGKTSIFLMSLTWGGYQDNDIDICPIYGLEYANFRCDVENDSPSFYKYDGYRYQKCNKVDPYEGFYNFLRNKQSFVEDIIELFQSHTLTPGIFQF